VPRTGESNPIPPGLPPWKKFDSNIITGDTALDQDFKEFMGSLNDIGIRLLPNARRSGLFSLGYVFYPL
jgi:hypothetical protein